MGRCQIFKIDTDTTFYKQGVLVGQASFETESVAIATTGFEVIAAIS